VVSKETVARALEDVEVDVQSIEVSEDGARVAIRATLTDGQRIPRTRVKLAIQQAIQAAAPAVRDVVVALAPPTHAPQASSLPALPDVAQVICVGSGKGGVGKSTITANLAAALARDGRRVGVIDADVYGYSIPRMLGVVGEPPAPGDGPLAPLRSPDGIAVMSIGLFLPAGTRAIVWRGPMLHKALKQFVADVDWGELDVLLVDLPPGTGDVSMTLAGLMPDARFLLVTTPQPAAQDVAVRAADLAAQFGLDILGVLENMAAFSPPGGGPPLAIFGSGGGQLLADELRVPLLGSVPLDEALRAGADEGRPAVLSDDPGPAARAILAAARTLTTTADTYGDDAAAPAPPAVK
jgi:ATP-binding protein involved in chromosome partitioning